MVERPVYAPALVAFVGIGEVAGIGMGPAIGWIPLGPQEAYVPAYRVSETYIRNVNVTNVTNVVTVNNITNNVHLNQNFMTAVHQSDFAASHPVQHAALELPPSAVAKGPGPIVREPGLRPRLDPIAVVQPPSKVNDHPLAGAGHLVGPDHFTAPKTPRVGTAAPQANLALPPPPKDAVRGRTPVSNAATGNGIAPLSPPTGGHKDDPALKHEKRGIEAQSQLSSPAKTKLQTNVNPNAVTNLNSTVKAVPRPQPPPAALTQTPKQPWVVTPPAQTQVHPSPVKTIPGATVIEAALPTKPQSPAKAESAPDKSKKDKKSN
jgi:hypothetical protein